MISSKQVHQAQHPQNLKIIPLGGLGEVKKYDSFGIQRSDFNYGCGIQNAGRRYAWH